MTDTDLTDHLSMLLSKTTGRPRGHWRAVLGPVKRYPLATHAHCNWQIDPSGDPDDVEIAERALDVVRAEHPYIV